MRLILGEYEQNIAHCRKMMKEGFFEFDFPFVSSSESFREINRFLWESRHQCTRFKNHYEGRAVIDITDWNKHFPNEYFDAFLYFLKGNESNVSCTLISSEPYTSEIRDRINRLFDTKEINLYSDKRSKARVRQIGFSVRDENEEEIENV